MTLREAIEVVESMQANSAAAVSSWDAENEPDPRGLRDMLRRKVQALRLVIEAAKKTADDTASPTHTIVGER